MEERLADDVVVGREGHDFRYRLAAGFVGPGDVVLDAACGTGYGQPLLGPCHYVGVDLHPGHLVRDLRDWEPDFPFDVAVSFETIEHLDDYMPLVRALRQARKWVIASVPVVPTVADNLYHRHDFAPGDLLSILLWGPWSHYQTVQQPSERSEIVVMRRRP